MRIVHYNINNKEIESNTCGDWAITRTFDEKGNLTGFKNSKGSSYEVTFDDKGRQLTFKNSEGYSSEHTYDDGGRLLTCKCYQDGIEI